MDTTEAGPDDIVETDDGERDEFLEWERVGGERKLLIEDESVYAEDLVNLGIAWQEFASLVVRKRS